MKCVKGKARKAVLLLLSVVLLCNSYSCSVSGGDRASGFVGEDGRWHESEQVKRQRIAWWREAKFGVFIHWGLYSVPAGVWKDKQVRGYGEWIMWHEKIPVGEYEQLAGQFNPVRFNADEWVKLARAAGMKYMVITAKHHDGFAMYHSKASPYNIVDATPFKRDPIKELADACRKEGIKFGCYYSVDRDWHHPDAFCPNQGQGNTWDYPDDSKKDFNGYLNDKALPQLKEILTQYGPLGIIWFDGVGTKTAEQNEQIIAMVRTSQPDCLINSRLGDWKKFVWGDYRSMDDDEVADEMLPYGWENPGTMNGTYAYKSTETNWRSHTEIIQMLADISSKGGNYLLNIGPRADGVVPAEAVRILQEVGKWIQKYGQSIYATTGSPIGRPAWGRCTAAPGKLYLHIFEWPTDEQLVVPNVKKEVKKAYLLADTRKTALSFETTAGGDLVIRLRTIGLPPEALDVSDTVVVLETGS
ncbi:MAG: alpha-L-fucosidase [Planctomycetota bacterium]|jgi:alpha-L-fucosidase